MTEKITNNVLPILKYYYGSIKGNKDIDLKDQDVLATANTLDYLFDCGFTTAEITREIGRHRGERIEYKDLSEDLWNGSLIKKGAFYLHRSLRLMSSAPVYSFETNETIEYPYYCEMRIRFTEDDVLDYFCSRLSFLSRALEDREYDRHALKGLLLKYSAFDYVEPLDIILCSIDNHLKQHSDCYRLIDVTNTNQEVIKTLLDDMMTLNMTDSRKLVSRNKCLI